MSPALLHSLIIVPTLKALERYDTKPGLSSPEAREMLLAIACQESALTTRRQLPRGPARSFWQIEVATAIDTVERWEPLGRFLAAICIPAIDRAIEHNDAVGCAVARGILRLDSQPLPALGDEAAAWDYYLRTWRPGKPRPGSWPYSYRAGFFVRDSRS